CADGCVPTVPLAEQSTDAPWTFSGSAVLLITDLFNVGDRFEVFDNLAPVGVTSVVVNTGLNVCDNDINCPLTSDLYSQASLALGAGSHSITIDVIQNAFGFDGGAAVFSVSAAAVPAPGTWLLLGSGLVGLGLALRLRLV